MTPSELTRIGEALYGPRWKSPLARALGTSHKTVWAWATGKHRPNAQYRQMIEELAASPRVRLAAATRNVNRAIMKRLTEDMLRPNPLMALLLKNAERK